MRSQIPGFRLPEAVLDEECGYVLGMGVSQLFNQRVESMKEILDKGYDAVVVGTGAPKGRDLDLPGRQEADANIHIGINWLASVAFQHTESIGKKVLVLGGGNTAMDCCRTARRLGGDNVIVTVRSTYEDMKASPWEKEDAMREDIPFECNLNPLEYVTENGKLVGMKFDRVESVYDSNGKRTLKSTGEDPLFLEADDVIVAVGQKTAFPWIENDLGIDFNQWGEPEVDRITFQSTLPRVFFAGDAAFRSGKHYYRCRSWPPGSGIDRFVLSRKVGGRAPRAVYQPLQSEDGYSRVELRQQCNQRRTLRCAAS
ncbi:MAG: FAD-dependent oxidoreductase [Porticoccaceae bacterium]